MRRMILVVWLCLAASSVYAEGGWIADKNTGCKVWNPHLVPDEAIVWSGECKNGKASGRGVLKWYKKKKLSSTLEGLMKAGQCYHNCLVTIKEGDKQLQYIGELENNIPGGHGTMIFSNGDKYIGDFKDGNFTGKGTYTWSGGDREDRKKYVGDFKDGVMSGHGTMIYVTGDKYSGSWLNKKRHGKGTYTFKDGTSYKGLWEHGERIKIF
ncbi:MAG: hypothetical protein D3917_14330 [Candidatus Electrothrix sp. AX5]|nr:hypothetical protein [Candidatus Electrothrix sp. AX5]